MARYWATANLFGVGAKADLGGIKAASIESNGTVASNLPEPVYEMSKDLVPATDRHAERIYKLIRD